MAVKLNYATRQPRHGRLLPVILSLAGNPLVSAVASVIGCAAALGWPLSPRNFRDSCIGGLICGILGQVAVALLARSVRGHPLLVSLAGLLATSISVGIGVFYFVASTASI